MLRFLGVRHLAVIDHLEVEFEPGLTVLTGETGAGKSILVQAIELLVGARASSDLIRTGEERASAQAVFEDGTGRETIIRREVATTGRSRAFVNDALATSGALRELGRTLIDLHGQHEHQTLLDPAEHVTLLDAFAGDAHQRAVADVASLFDAWRQAAGALERSRLDDQEKQARSDMAAFQLQEIERVAPEAGEDERLATERAKLANADRLIRLSGEAYSALYDGETAALASLADVWKRVEELAGLGVDPQFDDHLRHRDEVKSRLEDLAFVLREYATDVDVTPDRLQKVEDRLAALERLKRKYGPGLDAVIERQLALKTELDELGASDERALMLESIARERSDRFTAAARALSKSRTIAAVRLGHELAQALGELAMPDAGVEIRVRRADDNVEAWGRQGIDIVEFFLAPNPGEELRPLARIASGGELSRVMLALRTLATQGESTDRTLVFDEVDAGIGGEAADAVGARLQALAGRYQVLCVTHLPQIAARGDTHFQISKAVRGGRTMTTITQLDDAGRQAEIGRMIAGAEISEGVLASARDLLAGRVRDQTTGEQKTKAKTDDDRRITKRTRSKRRGA